MKASARPLYSAGFSDSVMPGLNPATRPVQLHHLVRPGKCSEGMLVKNIGHIIDKKGIDPCLGGHIEELGHNSKDKMRIMNRDCISYPA